MKWIILIACLIYILSPVDALPGPIDDAVVTVAAAGLTAVVALFDDPKEFDRENR